MTICDRCGARDPFSPFEPSGAFPNGFVITCPACLSSGSDLLAARELKVCRGCALVLPYERFTTGRSTRDGLSARCKRCLHARAAQLRDLRHYGSLINPQVPELVPDPLTQALELGYHELPEEPPVTPWGARPEEAKRVRKRGDKWVGEW